MDETLFRSLIARPESKTLDFKAHSYQFQTNKETEDAKFIKDLISFANTVRNETAYIIIGIKDTGQENVLEGIADLTDDAIFQQKAKDKIWPKPNFSVYRFHFEDRIFGIIEIPIFGYQGPLVVTKQLKGVELDRVYLRRGTSNSEGTAEEINHINQWLAAIRQQAVNIKPALHSEVNDLINDISNPNILLSATISKSLSLTKKFPNDQLKEFCVNELTGYGDKGRNKAKRFSYRLIDVPATPYDMEIKNFAGLSADQMIDYMLKHEQFQAIKYFFNSSIVDLEALVARTKVERTLALYKFPYKKVFPTITSNIPMATIFVGPQAFINLYSAIRRTLLTMLVKLHSEID